MTVSDKINILIVEDNEDHLFFIKKALSDSNYILQHIVSGTEAYNYLLNPKIKPDVVLLDNHLPGMSGLEILKKLGAKTKDYGFIVTTVDKDPEIIVDSMRAGALDFSPKTPEYFYILPQRIDKVYRILKDKLEKIEKEKQYKTVIETTNDAVIFANHKGEITEWNKASEKLFGYSKKEILGKPITLIMPNKYISLHNKSFKEAVKNGYKSTGKYFSLEAVSKQGVVFPIELTISTWQKNDNIVFCAFIRDVSHQKKIEKDLFNKNQFLKKPFNLTPLAFVYFDTNSIVRMWNPAAEKLFGYTAQEAIGNSIMDLIIPPDIKDDIKKVRDAVLDESGHNVHQNENITKSGKRIICNWYNSEIKDENNKVIGLAALGQDVTRQTHLENTIKSIEKNISFKSGKDYYVTLAKELNKRLNSDYVVIGLYNKKNNTNTILSHLLKNRALPNKTFDLKGTACEKVIAEGYFYQKEDVLKNFKVDVLLQKIKVNSYMGVAIYNSKNDCIGSIGAMFCIPIADEETFKILMKFFAHKIASECERTALVEALKTKQEELLKAQEMAHLGSYVLDLKTQTFNCSTIAEHIAEFSSTDKKTISSWHSLIHPDDLNTNLKMIDDCIKTGKKFDREYRIYTKVTKTLKWLHGTAEIVFKDNEAYQMIGTIQDITKQKQLQITLLNSKSKLKEAQKITNLGTFELDDETGLFKTSAICDSIVGMDNSFKKDMAGWHKIVYMDDHERLHQIFDDLTHTHIKEEFRIIRQTDKKIIWVLVHIKKEFNKQGLRRLLTGTIQEITARKEAEQALLKAKTKIEASEKTYRAMFNDNHAVMFIIDPVKQTIVEANQSACKFYGYTKAEFKNKKVAELNTLSKEAIAHEMDLVKKEKKNYFNFEHRLANGQIHQVEVYSSRVMSSGKPFLYSIIHDVTQRKLVEQALKT